MTINLADNTPRIEYSVAQGVVQTVFAVPFEFFDNGDLTVYVDGVQKYEGSDFSISGGDGSTGSITFNTAVPPEVQQVTGAVGGSTVVIVRDIAIERTTDFTSNAINRAALNTQLDTIIGMIADLDDKASRTLQISDYEIAPDLSLPSIEDRAGRVIAFDENGNAIAGPTADEVINGEEYATQSAASAAAAALSATAAATSETNAETSEAAAAASAAAALVSETAAASSESSAATSETNAANSEIAAASSAMSAASSATDAATSETNAAISATAAATSASAAATSATNAATSETNAATSATAAAASQVAAAASAASAANSYDLFDDRYLGSKTSDPTLDNDGNALVAGALYFNSTANEMRVYDGVDWIAASSAGGVSLVNYNFTATAGQTVFSGADDNAVTLSYTQSNLIVTLNGIVLEDGSDYTATDGTSITLAVGAALNDELNVAAFKSFTVADTYSRSEADAAFATAAQGALADTAVQPNDNVTLGVVTATSFSGDGSALTGLSAGPTEIVSSGTASSITSLDFVDLDFATYDYQLRVQNLVSDANYAKIVMGFFVNNLTSVVTMNCFARRTRLGSLGSADYVQLTTLPLISAASETSNFYSLYPNTSSDANADFVVDMAQSSSGSYSNISASALATWKGGDEVAQRSVGRSTSALIPVNSFKVFAYDGNTISLSYTLYRTVKS